MTPETIIIFAVSIVLLYIKPGPNQAMKITRALNDGFLPAYFFTIGATSMVVIYFMIATLGASALHEIANTAGFYFKIIGGSYLFYLGYKGLSQLEKGVWQGRIEKSHKKEFLENYSLGLVMTMANPLTIFYFLGIVPSFVALDSLQVWDIIVCICVILFAGNLADIILIALVSQVKTALSETAFVRKINIFSSLGFICIGSFFLYSAFFLSDFSYTL